MSNELAAVVTTYEVELVRADRMSRNDGPLDERTASDSSQGLQTTSRREPGSCPTGEHQALHDGTAQRQWCARAIKRSWDCIQGLSDATGDLQAASPAVLLGLSGSYRVEASGSVLVVRGDPRTLSMACQTVGRHRQPTT